MGSRILLVDDEPNNVYLLKKMLDPYGLIFTAPSGEDAFDMFVKAHKAGKPFDVIFLDIILLDGIHGDEVLRRIREWESFYLDLEDPLVSVVIASSIREREVIDRVLREGCEFFMNKPYRIENISTIMNTLEIDRTPIK